MSAMPDNERREQTDDWYAWFLSYCDSGFTEKQAMQLLCKQQVNVTMPTPAPEQYEFMERQNALATKLMTAMEEHDE